MKNNILQKGKPTDKQDFSADRLRICCSTRIYQVGKLAAGSNSCDYRFQQTDQKTMMTEQPNQTNHLKFLLGI